MLVTATSSPHGGKGLLITQGEGAIDERLHHASRQIHSQIQLRQFDSTKLLINKLIATLIKNSNIMGINITTLIYINHIKIYLDASSNVFQIQFQL